MKMGYFFVVITLSLMIVAGQWVGTVSAQGPAGYYKGSQVAQNSPAPDNTKTNKDNGPTADQQKMNASDRDITKKIRSSIMADKSLSTYAHNVKVISQNGRVTLKGPVRSDDEKNNVAGKAAAVIGDSNVDNQLDVMPPK